MLVGVAVTVTGGVAAKPAAAKRKGSRSFILATRSIGQQTKLLYIPEIYTGVA